MTRQRAGKASADRRDKTGANQPMGRRSGPGMPDQGRGLNLPPGPGRAGEAAAESHLRSLGYRVLARNYRTRAGEVDIVALDGETCVFVEVKARRRSVLKFGLPEESLTRVKQARLVSAAQSYLEEHGLAHADWRIDLAAIELDGAGRVARVELFKGAVSG